MKNWKIRGKCVKGFHGILGGLLAACVLAGCVRPIAVYAAAAAIGSVNIRVGMNDFEPGNTLPGIVAGSKDVGDSAYAYTSHDYYSVRDAQWITSTDKYIQVGDTPRMKVWLEPADYDTRKFKGGYYSSNVKITGGTFKSASISGRELVVTLELNPIKGQFPAPVEAYWQGNSYGHARWKLEEGVSGSHRYEVVLYRGSSSVHRAEVTASSYNFYPYMTKKGDYSFRVRMISSNEEQGRYGKASEWAVSDEIYLPEEAVSDGSGQGSASPSGGSTEVGWIRSGDKWYFLYPDGSCPKGEWLAWNGKWYLFDAGGRMLTGWQNRNDFTYYMDESGAMATGWLQSGNAVYYLNPTKDQFEGVMLKDRWVQEDGNFYYLNQDGVRSEGWVQIDGNWYYFYPGTGIKAANTVISGFVLDGEGIWRK